jgi:hypothetical protein
MLPAFHRYERQPFAIIAVGVNNPDRSPFGVDSCDAAPTPTGFAEIVSDDFPELHADEFCPF